MTHVKTESVFADIKDSVLSYFKSNDISGVGYELKEKQEIVTKVDRDVEAIVIGRILRDFPDHRIVSEESGVTGEESDYVWFIDPVDNTVGLVSGERDISTSVSLKYRGGHLHSAVINPRTGDIYEASDGGSFRNGKRILTCKGSLYDKSKGISTCAYVRKDNINPAQRVLARVFENRLPLRISGGSALDLCFVAEGKHIAHVSLGAHYWDVEAGIHMVEKAQGVVEIIRHYPRSNAVGILAAANRGVMEELKALFGDILEI